MGSPSWAYLIITGLGTGLLGLLAATLNSWFQGRNARALAPDGDVTKAPAQEVLAGDWRIIGWYERETARLRLVEEKARTTAEEYVRLQRRFEELDARCKGCPRAGGEPPVANGSGA